MDSCEREINSVPMTIIGPGKEMGLAGDRTSDLLFSSPMYTPTLETVLHGLR